MADTAFNALSGIQQKNIRQQLIRELRKLNLNNEEDSKLNDTINQVIRDGEDV